MKKLDTLRQNVEALYTANNPEADVWIDWSYKNHAFVVNEIIKPHSCKEIIPTTLEGKAMATADGAAHFLTDFYPLFCWRHYGPEDDYQVFKTWMLAKMEKDFTKKLFFDDVKQEVLPRYEALKLVFC